MLRAPQTRRTTARSDEAIPSLPRRILLVETEPGVRHLLHTHLELAGFQLEEASDGRAALERLRTVPYDVIILDAAVPGLDGVTLCRAARSGGPNGNAGIVMLSERTTESERVLGLSSGADDYITKPFGIRELLARVAAILRRTERAGQPATQAAPHQAGPLALDLARRQAYVRGHRVELTRQEFDVLHQLSSRPGMVFSRASLLEHVWSQDSQASLRTVDVAISRLRRKIEVNPHNPQLILTAWGLGYKFAEVPSSLGDCSVDVIEYQIPTSKLQVPMHSRRTDSQFRPARWGRLLGIWRLGVPWSLGCGPWDLTL